MSLAGNKIENAGFAGVFSGLKLQTQGDVYMHYRHDMRQLEEYFSASWKKCNSHKELGRNLAAPP